jgi:chromate transporter
MTWEHLLLGNFANATSAQWWSFFLHFLAMSFLAIGGAITVAPEMHRVLVDERGWLRDADFAGSIALAQAAPGPNVLFVAVVGYKVAGTAGAVVAMVGMILPSALLAVSMGRLGARHHQRMGVRAAVSGLVPVTLGLFAATGWVLIEPWTRPAWQPVALAVVLVSAIAAWKTRISPLWPIGAGALLGAAGWV